MYWNILFFPVYGSFSSGMSKWARHDKSLEYDVMYVAKHLRHWIAHFIFKINNYERMTSITKYRVDSMYSKSVFIYFSIILYIVEISQSTSAPSVDSHRSNRDSGAHRDNNGPSSFIMLSYYKSLFTNDSRFIWISVTTRIWIIRMLVIWGMLIFALFILIHVLLVFLTTVSFKNKTPMC